MSRALMWAPAAHRKYRTRPHAAAVPSAGTAKPVTNPTALDLPALGLNWGEGFTVHDEITGGTWQWGQYNYVRLEPWHHVAHIFRIVR